MIGDPYSNVLWVDDHLATLQAMQSAFPGGAFASSGVDAILQLEHAVVRGRPFDVIVTDVCMPDMDGIELCARAKVISPETRRVLISAFWGAVDPVRACVDAGSSAVLDKPMDADDMRRVLDVLIERRKPSVSETRLMAVDPERMRAAEQAHDDARAAVLACTSVAPKRTAG